VLATLGLVSLPSQLVPMEAQVSHVILLIGLAVGVDYSLFYLRREREERRAGRSESAALEAAAATSGRAVLISGFTVIIAMAGMLLSRDKTFTSFAIGTMMVVTVAMVGSLTVLPAVLSKLGDRVEKGRIPFLHRLRRTGGEGGRFWGSILRPVLRHPVIFGVASAAVLVVLALPALQLHTADSGLDALPKSQPELQAFRAIDAAFPGGATAAVVAIKGEDGAGIRSAIAVLKTKALASGEMQNPIQVERSPDGSAFQVDIPLAGEGADEVSNHALATLRDEILPATVGTVPGVEYAVGGPTARSHDFNAKVKSSAPLVFGFVLLFAFLLLLAAFRSVVIGLTAIVLNLLSVAAAYGMLVAVFQWGWGENLLDFNSTGGIASWLPLFLFVILFGLSMDYHVFILSRIREAFDRGLKTEDAVEHGIRTSAGVVTGASIVMVGVFGVFATLPLLDLKEMGIGLAAAILIDATIVRAVLLPATMKLLGDANWYLPKRLGWLPRLEHETEAPAEVAPPLAPAA
jgi:RND superfamily putative drug exporter